MDRGSLGMLVQVKGNTMKTTLRDKLIDLADSVEDREIPLYCRYPRETICQRAYLTLRLQEKQTVDADSDPEIGNAVPADVYHRRAVRVPLTPTVRGGALASWLRRDDVGEAVQAVADGYTEEWDGHNVRGHLDETALAALDTLRDLAEELNDEAFSLAVWLPEDWLESVLTRREDGWTLYGYGPLAGQPDETLREWADSLDDQAYRDGVILDPDLYDYLIRLRDESRED